MDTKLQDALKRANTEVETSGISDPELRKIAFSKAVDFYLREEKEPPQPDKPAPQAKGSASDFWATLVTSVGISEKKLKDVYSVRDEQISLVMSSIPGESKADRQRNLAALVLLAYHEGLGHEWVSSSLLAEAAGHSKLYDTSKFSKNLKSDWFRSHGVKKGQKYKLSGPGVSQAKNLLTTITQ